MCVSQKKAPCSFKYNIRYASSWLYSQTIRTLIHRYTLTNRSILSFGHIVGVVGVVVVVTVTVFVLARFSIRILCNSFLLLLLLCIITCTNWYSSYAIKYMGSYMNLQLKWREWRKKKYVHQRQRKCNKRRKIHM